MQTLIETGIRQHADGRVKALATLMKWPGLRTCP